jgi:uncharacterized protein YggE
MDQHQIIRQPFGITTFGSAVLRTDPDVASVQFAITRTEQLPKQSFQAVREASKNVTDYLQRVDFKKDTSSSRLSLSQAWKLTGGTQTFIGYKAKAGFHVLLYDLEQLENLLIGIVDAGANEINDVNFQTSRLKELRAQARRKAVEAAREKAENYCQAAQVKLGKVIHIEDVNPDSLSGRFEGHVMRQVELDDSGTVQAFNPGSITINAAVLISFNIADNEE